MDNYKLITPVGAAEVGSAVGCCDIVGSYVEGWTVGIVGTLLGWDDGCDDGYNTGWLDGWDVGCKLGILEGWLLGGRDGLDGLLKFCIFNKIELLNNSATKNLR